MIKHLPFTKRLLLLIFVTFSAWLNAQSPFQFTQMNSKLTATTMRSGGPVCIVDWNNDGLDDIVRLNQGNTVIIELQKTGSQFQTINLGSMGSGAAWAMCVADVDNNGYKDIIAGWGSTGRLMKINNAGTAGTTTVLPNSNFFFQNITAGDFNNDGWIDLFCCDDVGENTIYVNDGTGNFSDSGTSIINFDVTTTDDSGNYGSVFTDFDNDGDLDLYIAKCRQGVNSPTDGRRINVLFVNNGDGTYTERAADFNINIGWQTWTASFGDIDNDGDFDLLLTNHDAQSQIFENINNTTFVDISTATGFNTSDITPIQSVFEDFDNDGFVDILISGTGARIWRNNGNKTFSRIDNVFSPSSMLSFATGDLNNDGKVDLYTSYGTVYVNPSSSTNDIYWFNRINNQNNFFTLRLEGTVSNVDAIGANAFIYGPWGVQRREVRSGESYGTVNSFKLHFGLGSANQIDSLVIRWPSGIIQTIQNPAINQFLYVKEQECISPQIEIASSNGSMVICPGQTVVLTAPAGYNYNWSTGETTQSITIDSEGEYNVNVIETGNNCNTQSTTVNILVAPDQTPEITALGDTKFCEGQSVTLKGLSNLFSPVWSNGQVGSELIVTQTGIYTLTIQGACGEFVSLPIEVEVTSAGTPSIQPVTITTPQIVTLVATNGNNVTWWDSPSDGNQIGSGSSYTTPTQISENTTVYAQSSVQFGGDSYFGGINSPSGSSQYSIDNTTNALTSFTVLDFCTLKSVTVHTDTPGERKIELRDEFGTLIDSILVNITGVMTVELGFNLQPGVNYTIGTDGATNQLIPGWGFVSPRLKRNSSGVNYPYDINNLVSITGSNYGSQFYYYFYNWEITTPFTECIGNRVEGNILFEDEVSINTLNAITFALQPNPAHQSVQLITSINNGQIRLFDSVGRILLTQNIVENSTTLNIEELPKGIYFVQLTSDGKSSTQKLVKN